MQKYRPDIDGLRAAAVLPVLGFHAFANYLRGGYVGVDAFFVISGFLISGIIEDEVAVGRFSFVTFYGRRARRIFPALILVLLATIVGGWIMLLPDEFIKLGRQILAGAFFASNILSWSEAGYFDVDSNLKPLLHLWSLAVEEQFYIFWPITMILLGRAAKLRLKVIAAIILISFALNVLLIRDYPTASFYLPVTRVWELAIGALLASFVRKGDYPMPDWARDVMSAVGSALLLGSAVLFDAMTPFPGWYALAPTVGTALIIWAGPSAVINRRLFSHPLTVYIGRVSYPLYLWHWPLLAVLRINAYSETHGYLRVGALVLSFVLAAATYHFVERPIRYRWATVRTAGYLTAAIAAVGLMGFGAPYVRAQISPQTEVIKPDQIRWGPEQRENAACNNAYRWDHKVGWWFCLANSNKPPSLIILGDSYANHLYPGMAVQPEIARNTILSLGTCDPVDGLAFIEQGQKRGGGENPCVGERKIQQDVFIRKVVQDSPSVRFAILSALWPHFTPDGGQAEYLTNKKVPPNYATTEPADKGLTFRQQYMNGLERRIAFIESRKIRVIVFRAPGQLPYDVRKCIPRPYKKAMETCVVPAAVVKTGRDSFNAALDELKKRHPNMLIYDPLDTFCDQTTCRFVAGGDLFLRDDYHLSVAGSKAVAERFAKWAETNVPDLIPPAAPRQ